MSTMTTAGTVAYSDVYQDVPYKSYVEVKWNPEVAPPLIIQTPGVLGGKPRIAGHRISVQDVAIWHERMGKSVDEIATEYNLTLGQVYAALSYYHDHREEIDDRIRQGAAAIEDLKQRFPSKLAGRRGG
jgi:uncharacterized protein (DUF433 family)